MKKIMDKVVQYIIMRKDLNMRKGKMICLKKIISWIILSPIILSGVIVALPFLIVLFAFKLFGFVFMFLFYPFAWAISVQQGQEEPFKKYIKEIWKTVVMGNP